MDVNINEVFAPALTTTKRYIHLWGGRSRGATHFVTQVFFYLLISPNYFRGCLLRSTLGEVRQGLWVAIMVRIKEAITQGLVKERDFRIETTHMSIMYLPTGNAIISKGFQTQNKIKEASMKGLEGLSHAVIDEAEDVNPDDFDKFDDSLRAAYVEHIKILLLFNPPHKNHWLIKRHYRLIESEYPGWYRAEQLPIASLLAIHSTWHFNSKNVHPSIKAKMHARGDVNSPEYNPDYHYRNGLGLISEGRKGRIFTKCKSIPYAEFRELPYPSFYGLDWGFNDPNAVVELKYNNGRLYRHEVLYEGGLENNDMMKLMRSRGIKPNDRIYYDIANPKDAKTFRKGIEYGPDKMKGFNMLPSTKGADSILNGIKELQAIEIYTTDISTNLRHEEEEYRWMEGKDRDFIDTPEDAFNHGWDATRYGYTAHVKTSDKRRVSNPADHNVPEWWEVYINENGDNNQPPGPPAMPFSGYTTEDYEG